MPVRVDRGVRPLLHQGALRDARASSRSGSATSPTCRMYCVPTEHHPVTPTDGRAQRYGGPISFVGNRYPYRERFVRALRDYPLRLWGRGWTTRRPTPRSARVGRALGVRPREARSCTAASTLSLNHHHPMNDIVGVNTRTFELAAAGACQVVDLKEDLPTSSSPARSRRLSRPRRAPPPLDLTWRIPTRRAPSARTRAAAPSPSTRCAIASRRSSTTASTTGSARDDERLARAAPHLHRVRRDPSARPTASSARRARGSSSCATTSTRCAAARPRPARGPRALALRRRCSRSTIPPTG